MIASASAVADGRGSLLVAEVKRSIAPTEVDRLLEELRRKAEQCPVLVGRQVVLRLFSAEGQRGPHPAVLTAGDVLDAPL